MNRSNLLKRAGASCALVFAALASHAAPILWVSTGGAQLATVDVSTGATSVIGGTGTALTDIAFSPTGDLYGSDNKKEKNFNSGGVATTERTRLEAALTSSAASPSLFPKDSAVPLAKGPIETFARSLREALPHAPKVPVKVDGYVEPDEAANKKDKGLAKKRAKAVGKLLKAAGGTQPIVPADKGQTGSAGDANARKVDLSIDHAFEGTYAGNSYSVSAHEFGHLLGNPDEYVDSTAPGSNALLNASQTKWTALVVSAGLKAPVFGEDTSSQMSNGIDVIPAHYITLWEVLGQMTAPDIKQAEWKLG